MDALFRQAGVIRTDTLDEMLDVAELLAHQPLPTGRRIGIVTNVGGPANLCADACEANGLEVAALSDQTRARLRRRPLGEPPHGLLIDRSATVPATTRWPPAPHGPQGLRCHKRR